MATLIRDVPTGSSLGTSPSGCVLGIRAFGQVFHERSGLKLIVDSFRGDCNKWLEGKCPTKGIDLRATAPSGTSAKGIGSRPAVELRFNPRAAFFI